MRRGPIEDHEGDRDSLERAADQALELRATLAELPDPSLREILDVVLLALGRRLASRMTGDQRIAAAGRIDLPGDGKAPNGRGHPH